jgi:hypothetical protein
VPVDLVHGDTCVSGISMTDTIMWFKFIADSLHGKITAEAAGIDSLIIYSGTCNTFSLFASAAVDGGDSSVEVDEENFTIGNTYYVKVKTQASTNLDICVLMLPSYYCGHYAFSCNYIKNGGFEIGPINDSPGVPCGIKAYYANCWEAVTLPSCSIGAGGNTPDLFDKGCTTCTNTPNNNCFQYNDEVGIPYNFGSPNGLVDVNPAISPNSRYASIFEGGGEAMGVELFPLSQGKYLLTFYTAPMECGSAQPTLCVEFLHATNPALNISAGSVAPDNTTSIGTWTPNYLCIDLSSASLSGIDKIGFGTPSSTQRMAFDDFSLKKLADAGDDMTITIGCCTTLGGCMSATAGMTYSWTPSTGLSCTTCPNPVACPTSTTTYSVTATFTDPYTYASCSATDDAVVTVNTNTISINPASTTICIGSSATLTASGGASYSWLPAGQTTTTIVVSPTSSTTYTVVGTYSTGCTGTATATVTVSSGPTIAISGTTTLCATGSTTLTASGGVSYSWSTGATTTSITVSPTIATCYTVTGTDANGCTNTAVECLTTDCPDFLYYDCKVYLDVDVFPFYSVATFGFVIKQWPSTCLSGSPTYSIDYTTMGIFQTQNNSPSSYSFLNLPSGHQAINLTDNFGVIATTASWLPPFAINKDISFELWDCSGTPFQIGSTDCITTPAAGCATVVTKTLDPTIQSIPAGFTFGIFPNPSANNFTLFYSAAVQSGFFELYDVYGNLCMNKNLIADKKSQEINISSLSNGIYYCRIKAGNDITDVKKIVIAK